jgi:manganese/iron transport system permease protein
MAALELRWWLGAILGGAGCGLAGFFLLALDLPFLAVCLAHAALAGAVLGHLAGLPPTVCAFAGALLVAALLGPAADRVKVPVATLSGILFSLSLGLAFLGIGLTGGVRAPAMSLLWGNLLLLDWPRLAGIGLVTVIGGVLALVFLKELKAVLFSRAVAWSCGLPAGAILYGLVAWCGLAITVNLEAVGGLMLYSLLVNPAAAARQLTDRFSRALALTVLLAAGSAAGGLALAMGLDWPAGASIVLVSSGMFAAAAIVRAQRGGAA